MFVLSLDLGDSPAFPELAHSGIFQSLFLSGRENVLDPRFPISKEASPTLTLQCQNNQLIYQFFKTISETSAWESCYKTMDLLTFSVHGFGIL